MDSNHFPILNVPTCTGCAACFSICPQHAIKMQEDREGFSYPRIDPMRCNRCGLCERTCPVLHPERLPRFENRPDVYVAWHKSLEIRRQSSSGGAFTALATAVLKSGGVVFGAAFDDAFLAEHVPVFESTELGRLRGSKYMQSRIGKCLLEVNRLLQNGKKVLFVGTPCQTAGLHAAVSTNEENLVSCNLICKGAPSPKVFRSYLDHIEACHNSAVVAYSFRDKFNGWRVNESVAFSDGTIRRSVDRPFFYGFAKNYLYVRPSCYECPFKGLPTTADITLGDFWSIRKQSPSWDDDNGTSLILINSDRGNSLFEESREYLTSELCPFEFVEGNYNLMRGASRPRRRQEFFQDLGAKPFHKIIQKYMTPPRGFRRFLDYCQRRLRGRLSRLLRRKR